MSDGAVSRLVCAGCGAEPAPRRAVSVPLPERGPRRRRRPRPAPRARPRRVCGSRRTATSRTRSSATASCCTRTTPPSPAASSDDEFCALVRRLDERVAAVDGHGFATRRSGAAPSSATGSASRRGRRLGEGRDRQRLRLAQGAPSVRRPALARGGGAARPRRSGRAAGSRDRELRQRRARRGRRRGRRRSGALRVFVPVDADPAVLARLEELGAAVTVCPRSRASPATRPSTLLSEALAGGALPFTCQGNLNGLAVEGGETLGWEIAADGRCRSTGWSSRSAAARSRARASTASARRPRSARSPPLPRIDTVQTARRLAAEARLRPSSRPAAATPRRSRTRRTTAPSSCGRGRTEPHSVAHGILDDETYDWLAVVEGMLATGGTPVVVGEQHARRRRTSSPATRPASTSTRPARPGSPGSLALRDAGPRRRRRARRSAVHRRRRSHLSEKEEHRDAKLPGSRHPVAQGL